MKSKKITAILVCMSIMLSSICASAMEIASWTYRYGSYSDIVTEGQEDLWIRDIAEWTDFEKDENGIIIPDAFRDRYKRLKKEGKNIIMVLAYGNNLYSGSTDVVMPTLDNKTYFDAWLNYVRTMVTEFKDEVSHFEIWNEPNLSYANSNASAAEYAEMAVETKKVIEATHPMGEDAVVIGGAFAYARSHSQFVRDFCNNGGSEMDGLSFHIYDYTYNPEGKWAPTLLEAFGDVIDGLNYNKPIWFTETGYYTGTGESAVSEKEQASYMIRMQALWDSFLKKRSREGKIFWFFTNDWGSDRGAVSPNHGVLNVNGTAKDSYFTFKALNSLMKDKSFVNLTNINGTYKALYRNDVSGDELYILWNKNDIETAQTVSFDCDVVKVYNYKGELTDTPQGGSSSVVVSADGAPKFVECLNLGTEIKKIDYNPQKRTVMISGECNFTDTVTIEIEKGVEVKETAVARVIGGQFEKELYTGLKGSVTVYAGRNEAGASYYDTAFAELGDEEKKAVIENAALLIKDGNVNVSGTVKDAENSEKISVMVLPEIISTNDVSSYNLAYVGETAVSEGAFNHSFKMPENSEGKYRVYLGGSGISDVFSNGFEHGTNNQLVGVCDFSASKQNEVIVTACLNNTDEAEKNASVIIAQYDDNNRLKAVKLEHVTVEAGTVLAMPYYVNALLDADAATVKAFIFDDMKNTIPLSACVYAK